MKRAGLVSMLLVSIFLSACKTEQMRRNEEILRQQQEEIIRLRQELEPILEKKKSGAVQ